MLVFEYPLKDWPDEEDRIQSRLNQTVSSRPESTATVDGMQKDKR
jgi:hypothetical protein